MMERLTTIQKRKIKERYLTHWLYSHIAAPAKEMECRLEMLRISPEELFVECVSQLDSFLDHPGAYGEIEAPSLWNDYFCQLREESTQRITVKELELGATELTYVMNYLLCAMTHRMIATQAMLKLTQSLMAHADAFTAVEACFQPKIWTSHANQFVAKLGQYAEGQERLSASLLGLMEEANQQATQQAMAAAQSPKMTSTAMEEEEEGERFTLRQTIILCQELLNIPLDTEYTNLSQLARFIHRLTGYKMQSVRTAINKLKGLDQLPQKDLVDISKVIEEFNCDLAKEIRARHDS